MKLKSRADYYIEKGEEIIFTEDCIQETIAKILPGKQIVKE